MYRELGSLDAVNGPVAFGATSNEVAEFDVGSSFRSTLFTGARYKGLKRTLDILAAGAGLIMLLPVFLLVAAGVWLSNPGPVFYRQKRIGQGGQPFMVVKFRSMVVDSAACLEQHLASCAEARREWAETRKLKNDPRVTTIGHFLRKSSLDELPQLWNVLVGDMSIVGPRPVVNEELDTHYRARRKFYQAVKPGITGLWQVSGRNNTTYEARVQFDCRYVQSLSLLNDLKILFKTLPAVLKSSGAY